MRNRNANTKNNVQAHCTPKPMPYIRFKALKVATEVAEGSTWYDYVDEPFCNSLNSKRMEPISESRNTTAYQQLVGRRNVMSNNAIQIDAL